MGRVLVAYGSKYGATAEIAETERSSRPKQVQELAAEIQARDHKVFGGMVDEDRGFIRRRMAHNLPEATRDRRDRDDITAWATGIASALAPGG